MPADIDVTDSTPAFNRDDTDAINGALTLGYDIGEGKLKSITAYRRVDAVFGRDGDASAAVNYTADIYDERARQFSQELQYATPFAGGRGRLLLGGYYFRESTIDLTRLVVADGLYNILRTIPPFSDPAFPGGPTLATLLDFNIDFDNRQVTTNWAAFGNASFDLTSALTLELGGRFTHEKKRFTQVATRIYSGAPLLAGTPSYTLERSWDAFTPRVSLSWKARPNLLTYASFSQGFRSGGFNGRPTSLEEVGSYNPERLDAYEIGMKGQFGRAVTLNLAAFRNEYRDQQLLISTVSAFTGLPVVRTENAGRSRIQGLEAELTVRPVPAFTVNAGLGLLDAKYLRYVSVINGVPTDVSSRKPKQAPDVTFTAGAQYTAPLGGDMDATFRVDGIFRSEAFIEVENTELLKAPDHWMLNASVALGLPWSGASLKLSGENLTDRRVVQAGYDARSSFGFVEAFYNPPRRFFVTLAVKR